MTELQYLIVYFEVNLLAFIFLGIILFNVKHDFGSDLEVNIFKVFLASLMIALIVDCFTHAHYRHVITLPIPILKLLYSTHMFMMAGFMPLLWMLFAELRLGISVFKERKVLAAIIIPAAIVFILAYGSMWAGWYYTIDATGTYHRGPYWALQNLVPYGFFLVSTIQGLLKARKEQSTYKRKQYLVIASFVIAPFLGGVLQLVVGSHPFAGPAASIAMFFIYINIQVNMNNQDSLTTLNNRRRCIQYLTETIEETNNDNAFYLFLMDLNDFKNVNDTYGHIEGDNALKITANVIKECVDRHYGFVGRFGGDEFVYIIEKEHLTTPQDFINEINNDLADECKKLNLPYLLNGSFGYVECHSSNDDINKLIETADNMMYSNKSQYKIS